MNTASKTGYTPQTDRLGLLHRGISVTLTVLLMFYLSVCVTSLEPKLALMTAAICLFIGGKRLLDANIWPMLAIIGYGTFLGVFFPGSKPGIGLILQQPLYLLDCVLLSALVLGGQSLRRQYVLLLGILAVSMIGTIGDVLGHDMTALLPFQMPEDAYFDQVTLIAGNISRVRGFFPESGVLGAVSLGFGTMLGVGAVVLIGLRAHVRLAWLALLGAVSMGGAIFCLTITKSGLGMVGAGFAGYLAVLMVARNPRCRAFAVVALAGLVIAGGAFLVAGPSSLTTYFRGEITAIIHPYDMGASLASGHGGMITRYKCWLLAFTSLRYYPLGVGPYGLGAVVQQVGEAGLTNEMQFFFTRDVFGLKNALANLVADCGVVGIGLLFFWMWVAFVQPIRELLADGSGRSAMIAGVYGASALSCLVFLFSCELYPSLAFLLVLKCHADAVAQACAPKPRADAESFELIG